MALQSEESPSVLVDGALFLARLKEEIGRSKRYEHAFTVLTLRPPTSWIGQDVLTSDWFDSLAGRLVRGCDVVSVFENVPMVAVLLPETGISGAGALLERIRSVVSDPDGEWEYTILEYPTNHQKIQSFLAQAA